MNKSSEEKERLELRKQLIQAISQNDVKAIARIKKQLKREVILISSFLDYLKWTDHFNDPSLNFEFDPNSPFVKLIQEAEDENQKEILNQKQK